MKVKGIAESIIDKIVDRSNHLSQGRAVGTLGFVNEAGYIDAITELVDGGVSGLPYRQILSKVAKIKGESLLEIMNQLPENAVLITTNPGKTGLIVDTSGINTLNQPLVRIGVKREEVAGVGIIYPQEHLFELTTRSEEIKLKRLVAKTMEEEREVLKESSETKVEYLEICEELEQVDIPEQEELNIKAKPEQDWQIDYVEVNSIEQEFADKLVNKSITVEQGREVAALGEVKDGHIVQLGEIVVGGMGYVPSRLLASSCKDISGISLREAYTGYIPNNVVIVHTHPGGTGVMHMGDAMAGPVTWGRPVVAIGHDKEAEIKGATVIELLEEAMDLVDEYEALGQEFYEAETPDEESGIRKR
ncbi:MAG: peptidase S7, partial [Bacillota bacterium]